MGTHSSKDSIVQSTCCSRIWWPWVLVATWLLPSWMIGQVQVCDFYFIVSGIHKAVKCHTQLHNSTTTLLLADSNCLINLILSVAARWVQYFIIEDRNVIQEDLQNIHQSKLIL